MNVPVLGFDIRSESALAAAQNLDAIVPAAQRVESAVDRMTASALADLKAVSQQGFAQLNATAIQSLATLERMGQAKPIPQSLPSEADRAAAAFQKFKASIDATYRAELQLAQAQKTVDAALKSGKINAEQAAVAMRQYEASIQTAGGTGSFASQVQNASFQLGDFAVQVGAGTSASVALAQQLPQLLGGFGVLGAVLGAVVAIAVPVATAFFNIGDEAKDLDDRLSDLEDALANVEDAMALTGGTDALVERYGKATTAVRELARAMTETAAAQALASARALTEGQWAGFADTAAIPIPDMGGMITPEIEAAFDGATKGADRLADALKIGQEEARALQSLIVDARMTEAPEAQADAFARVRDALSEIRDEFGAITPEAQAMADETEEVEDALRRAAGMTDALASGMSGVTSATEAAGAAASNVANEIARAVGNLMNLTANAETALKRAQISSQFRGDPIGEAGARAGLDFDATAGDLSGTDPILRNEMQRQRGEMIAAEKERARLQEELAAWNKAQTAAARKSSGGGGGGKGGQSDTAKELEREQKARERIIEGLRYEMEAVGQSEVARRIANETRKAGVDIMSEEGQQIADYIERIHAAKEAQDRLTEANEFVANSFADMFTGAITGAKSFGDSIRSLLGQLGELMVQRAFMNLMTGSGFGASAGGQFLGGLLSFDGGGFTGNGSRSGGMDGKGGFLAMMHPRETVVDHTKGQIAGGGAPVFNINVPGATGNSEIKQMVRLGMQEAIRQSGANVPRIMTKHQLRNG